MIDPKPNDGITYDWFGTPVTVVGEMPRPAGGPDYIIQEPNGDKNFALESELNAWKEGHD